MSQGNQSKGNAGANHEKKSDTKVAPPNAPSKTDEPSGGNRGNNPPEK